MLLQTYRFHFTAWTPEHLSTKLPSKLPRDFLPIRLKESLENQVASCSVYAEPRDISLDQDKFRAFYSL